MSKDNLVKRFSIGLFWNQVRHFALYPLTFLLSIVLARGLGPTDYGIYTGLMAIVGILALFSSLGLEGVSSISLPKMDPDEDRPKATYFIRRLLVIRMLVTSLTLSVFLLMPGHLFRLIAGKSLIDDSGILLIAVAIYFFVSNLNLLSKSFYRGLLRFKTLSFVDTISYSLNLVLCFLVLNFIKDLSFVLGVLIFAQIVTAIFLMTGLISFLMGRSEKFDFRKINALSANLFATRMVQYTLGYQKDILLIGFFLQAPKFIGFYHIAIKITEAFNSLLTMGFGEVSLPSFAETFLKKGAAGLTKIWLVFIRLEVILTVPCLTFALINAKHIIGILYSDQFLPAVSVFQVFCAIILLSDGFLGGGTSQKVLYAISKQNLVLLIILLAGIFNLILDIILIPRYGVLGAAFATGGAMLVWRLFELIICIRLLKANFPLFFVLKITLAASGSCLFFTFIKITSLSLLFLSGILFSFSYIILLYLIKPFDSEDREVIAKVSSRSERVFSYFCRA